MLFRKNMEPHCGYCEHARVVDEKTMACVKKGIVTVESRCGAFRYDPLKRVPPRPVKLQVAMPEEDFQV